MLWKEVHSNEHWSAAVCNLHHLSIKYELSGQFMFVSTFVNDLI